MRHTTSEAMVASNPKKRIALNFAGGIGALMVLASFTTAHAESTGIPVCDNFLEKYSTCVTSKLPAAAQATYKTQLDQWRKMWGDLAKNPAAKSSMEATCQQAMDATKTALQSYGCSF